MYKGCTDIQKTLTYESGDQTLPNKNLYLFSSHRFSKDQNIK